jgi:hypothetical protein
MPADEPFVYEVPSASAGDQGLEGFSVEVSGQRVGRIAAVNAIPDGRALLVDTGDGYRPVLARFVAQIETRRQAIRLTPAGEEAFAASPSVRPAVRRSDTARLIRYVPRDFDRLMVAGERPASGHHRRWYVGAALVMVGLVASMIGPIPTAAGVGGSLRWLWIAIPATVLVLGAAALWTAIGRDNPRPLSASEKLADALALVFAMSPRTRRRG